MFTSLQNLSVANCHAITRARPVFAESAVERLRRCAYGTAYALQPKRIGLMPKLLLDTTINFLEPTSSIDELLKKPKFFRVEGYVGISDDVSAESILKAYKHGIFPVSHLGPMKWWSPEQRSVLFFENTRIEKSLRKVLRQDKFVVTFDEGFAAVLKACAEPRPGHAPLTWLSPRMMGAFWDLHCAGYAHSIEVWDLECRLVGGIFGVAVGKIFFGESQFSIADNASKVASVYLNRHLSHWGFALRDAKVMTPYIASLGFENISRGNFSDLLKQHVKKPNRLGKWEFDETLNIVDWRPQAPKAVHETPEIATNSV